MDFAKNLHMMCEYVSDSIMDANEKIRQSGGKLNANDVDYIDKLTHALKSIKAVEAMMEGEEDGMSQSYYPMAYEGSSRGMSGRSYRGSYNSYDGSYRRGMSSKRDSMGRYSREGDYEQSLREAIENAPDEQTRQSLQRMMDNMR